MKTIYNLPLKVSLIIFSVILISSIAGCKKFLEEKPDKSISTVSKLADIEGILDGYSIMNAQYPMAAELGSDDFYLINSAWTGSPEKQRNFYIWLKFDNIGAEWSAPYKCIYNANLILEMLPKLSLDNEKEKVGDLKGQALFIRAWNHYAIAQLFAPAYKKENAKIDQGIPLRLNTNYNQKSIRASVEDNYKQIIEDVTNALPLLSINPKEKYLPSKVAAYGFMARIYLQMQNYKMAGLYADSVLYLNRKLIDYNTLSSTASSPFKQFNEEVLYDCRTAAPAILAQSRARVNEELYSSYNNNDLRKIILFKINSDGSKAFKGNYTGLVTSSIFSGLAIDEILLIRAECFVRLGESALALNDLNLLLEKRFKTGTYIPITQLNTPDLLKTVLLERRKELLFRNIRWSDLKRLNLKVETSVTLNRTLGDQAYILEPNSPRYLLQIDASAIQESNMPQNH